MADRRTPFVDYLRDAALLKTSGLDEAALRQSPVPSDTSLLGLLKHLTMVEIAWFSFAEAKVWVPTGDLENPRTPFRR